MTRESIGIKYGDYISKKQAKAILVKFLFENRCVEDFVKSCNFKHNNSFQLSAQETIEFCINRLMVDNKYLDEIFDWGSISFTWAECTHIKSREYWRSINCKWKGLIDGNIKVVI